MRESGSCGRQKESASKPRRRTMAGIMVALGFFLVLGAALPSQLALTLTSEPEGARMVFPMREGEPFSIRFIHSVHRTPVEEHYRIAGDGHLVLESMIYETYGVGNPSEAGPGERFRMEGGKYVIEGMRRAYPEIRQRIGQIAANHELTVHGETFSLADRFVPGSRVLLRVEKKSLWSLWRGGASFGQILGFSWGT